MESAGQRRNECNDAYADQINLIHGEKAGIKDAGDKNIKYGREQCIQQDDHAASLLFLAPAIQAAHLSGNADMTKHTVFLPNTCL